MLHPIDRLLFDGLAVPAEVLSRELAKPVPPRGTSYWGDALWDLFGVVPVADLGTQAVALARTIVQDESARIQAASSP